jgi:UDP-N-acetylmuramate dehydrogenase
MNYLVLSKKIGLATGVKCRLNHSLKNCSSFHLGGTAGVFAEPKSVDELVSIVKYLRVEKISYFILGNGSNVIFSDKPYDGVIVCTKKLNKINIKSNIVHAESGVDLDILISLTVKKGLAGLEELSHIPGSLGGAVWMNAGAFHGEVSDYIVSVKILDSKNRIKTLNRPEIDFGYREVPTLANAVVLEVKFRLFKERVKDITRRRKEIIKKRNRKHPLKYPSAGSVFKRPEGHFVRRLIEESGMAGKRIGGAQVSKKHPGFIVNLGNAKSSDVIKLIKFVRERIYQRFRLKLELEQVVIGHDLQKMLE